MVCKVRPGKQSLIRLVDLTRAGSLPGPVLARGRVDRRTPGSQTLASGEETTPGRARPRGCASLHDGLLHMVAGPSCMCAGRQTAAYRCVSTNMEGGPPDQSSRAHVPTRFRFVRSEMHDVHRRRPTFSSGPSRCAVWVETRHPARAYGLAGRPHIGAYRHACECERVRVCARVCVCVGVRACVVVWSDTECGMAGRPPPRLPPPTRVHMCGYAEALEARWHARRSTGQARPNGTEGERGMVHAASKRQGPPRYGAGLLLVLQ